jgi:hypothetical protein
MGDLGLTYQTLFGDGTPGNPGFVPTSLGVPSITLHVKPAAMLYQANYVLNVYSRRKPRIKFQTVMAQPGRQNYSPVAGKVGYGVVGVQIPRVDPIAPLLLSAGPRLDIFGYRYSYPYRDISELEIDYMYFDMATRVLSSEIDWEWIPDETAPQGGQIWVYPAPVESFQFAYAWAAQKVLGDEVTQTPGTIPMADWDWFQDAVLARIKEQEGLILRRFNDGGIPGATGNFRTDGAQLVKEGREEWSAALEDLQLRTPELPFRKIGSSATMLPLGS